MSLCNIRKTLFWAADAFKGAPVRNNLKDIEHILINYASPTSETRRKQLLTELIHHATGTSPYYRHLKANSGLTDFPLINKNIVRNHYEDFKSAKFGERDVCKVMTSGSTGTPLVILQDKRKKIRNTADTIYFASKGGFKLGSQLIYMRLWSDQVAKSTLLARMQNIKMVNVTDLSEEYLTGLISDMQKNKEEKGLIGYVSGFTQLCKYLDRMNSSPINCKVTSIIAISESLSSYCREAMEKYFQTPVLSRYSNIENGILAQQFHSGDNYTINWASYVTEIFDLHKDVPVEYGTPGRIVITDLFNYAMPLLRYDTGDLGVMDIDKNGLPVLKTVEGRQIDMLFDTRGRIISPAIVWELEYYDNIKQFQLIQNDIRSYTFKLNVSDGFNLEERLIKRFKGYFGEDADIKIQKTNEIPVLASGKRRLVVNNVLQTQLIQPTYT